MSVETGLFALAILTGLLALRVPIGIALIAVGAGGILYLRGFGPAFGMLRSVPFDFTAHWTLSAVPMFVLMSAIASHSGLTRDLYASMRLWFGRLPGGLAIATSFAGAGFAAICGSSLATTAAMGRIAVPEMVRAGYDKGLAAGCAAAVGTVGALIPPSILMVLYALFAQVSVGKMLVAGLLPGLLTTVAYAVMIGVRCHLRPELAPKVDLSGVTLRDKAISLRRIWPVGLIAAMVVGVIYGGIATATEAGAIGAVATALLAFSQRTLDRRGLMQCANETVVTTATLLLIGIGATLLAQFLALSGVPRFLSGALQDVTTNHVAVILICCLIYLVMGAFLDTIGIMLLTLPILIPIFRELGINEIWAGVILVKMLEIGLLTPPLGMNVFVMNRVSGDSIKLGTIFRGVSWFLLVEIVVMALLIFIPAIILFLPSMMIG
ncbi:TRAP transporter large permease [Arenibacterium halophilum]|uniref:TRAP transporter large permease protein n=1 Tax=Arenibacterium halophilum TaxID=2583821 RepID=A0ABY2XDF0_9RHOB|nr:TRAP transporter large permease [Arenibacterium halophilum]TMV14612.1 TRAP transporter large permease [Arenibacterium halophilum]